MAFKLADLFVDIRANTAGFTASVAKVNSLAIKTKANLAGLGIAARNIFLLAGAALVGATSAAGSFEKSMIRVKAVTGATGDEFKRLSALAVELGKTTIYSAKEAADSARVLAIAGFKVSEIFTALPQVMHLAAAGNMEVADASDMAAIIMRGMNLSADQLGRAVDIMSKAFTSANTTLHQFGLAMTYVGPVASYLEISLEEIGAAIMSVSNAGIKAERAGTGLRRFLAELSRQASPTRNAMAKLGVSVTGLDGNLRPIADIIDDLQVSFFTTIPPAQRLGKAIEIFGLRAGPAVAAMLKQGGDKLREYRQLLIDSGGTAEYLAKMQMGTLAGASKMLKNVILEVGRSFGEVLIPTMQVAIKGFRLMSLWLSELPEATKGATGAFLIFTVTVSGLTLGLVKVMALLGAITAHPLVAVVTALAAIGAAVWYNIAAGETMAEKFTSIWGTMRDVIGTFVGWLVKTFGWLWDVLISNLTKAVKAIMKGMDWFKQTMIGAFVAVLFAADNWKSLLLYGFYKVAYGAVKFANTIRHFFGTVIPETLSWMADNWKEIFITLLDFFESVATNLWTNAENLWDALTGLFSGEGWDFEWTGLLEGFKSTISQMPEIAAREMGKLEQELLDKANELGEELGKAWEEHMEKYKFLFDKSPAGGTIKIEGDDEDANKNAETFGDVVGLKVADQLKNFQAFRGVEELARKIQEASLKDTNTQTKQLKELKRINTYLKNSSKTSASPLGA